MSRGDPYLKLWLMQKTAGAVKLAERARIGEHGVAYTVHWIPRSLIGYARTEPAAAPGELPAYVFTLPEWKIERDNLWKFETDAR